MISQLECAAIGCAGGRPGDRRGLRVEREHRRGPRGGVHRGGGAAPARRLRRARARRHGHLAHRVRQAARRLARAPRLRGGRVGRRVHARRALDLLYRQRNGAHKAPLGVDDVFPVISASVLWLYERSLISQGRRCGRLLLQFVCGFMFTSELHYRIDLRVVKNFYTYSIS